MEFKVGSIEELNYVSQLVQKNCNKINEKQIQNDDNILDVKEYKYLQFLVFKYCFIPNVTLSAS
jgi:hypothetical protein